MEYPAFASLIMHRGIITEYNDDVKGFLQFYKKLGMLPIRGLLKEGFITVRNRNSTKSDLFGSFVFIDGDNKVIHTSSKKKALSHFKWVN